MNRRSDTLIGIGEVAKQSGVTIATIRYYDEIGMVTVARRVGGKRRFEPDTIGQIAFIKRAQDAGFSLEEITAILEETRDDWHHIIETKLTELTDRRARLDTMIDLLTDFRDCGCQTYATCEAIPT